MKSNKLKIYTINSEYIGYLYKFDSNVMFNKESISTRPYIGILFKINSFTYFAPLTHDGIKWINLDDHVTLAGGNLGAIKFNKMIPIPISFINYLVCLAPIDEYLNSTNKSIRQYGRLLKKQFRLINNPETKKLILLTARNTYLNINLYRKSLFYCNFALLERIAIKWTMTYYAITIVLSKQVSEII